MNAVFFASKDLHAGLVSWKNGETKLMDSEKVLLSALKYWIRMCTRPTPFGLFAGCSLGSSFDCTKITLNSPNRHRQATRLDMVYLCELSDRINQLNEISHKVKFYTNDSIYRVHDKYRFIEYSNENHKRNYRIAEIDYSPILEYVISNCGEGRTRSELGNILAPYSTQVEPFVDELISNQILVSELSPRITGEDFLEELYRKSQEYCAPEFVLTNIKNIIQHLHGEKFGPEEYFKVLRCIKAILPEANEADLIQTDLFISTSHNTIEKKIVDEIASQLSDLASRIPIAKNETLSLFKESFISRYGDQEVDLKFALDTEAGIGYDLYTNSTTEDIKLLDGLPFPFLKKTQSIQTPFQRFIQSKYIEALRTGSREIILTDADFDTLPHSASSERSYPSSAAALGALFGSNVQDFRFLLKTFSGPSGANLIGRFCGADKPLFEMAKSMHLKEELREPDCIFAEIIHLPQSRIGNVVTRPVFRNFEIPYLTKSAVDQSHRINIDDLIVSIRNDRVVLRSKTHNKRVIPRMSTAHNYKYDTLPIYRFLCDLQYQFDFIGFSWAWEELNSQPFLPRITYKQIILSRAQWNFDTKQNPKLDIISYLLQLRERQNIPRFLSIIEGDNELFVDLENRNCLKIIEQHFNKKKQITLVEWLVTPTTCVVKDSNCDAYCNELVIPIFADSPIHFGYTTNVKEDQNNGRFMMGSEWLFLKIYCGTQTTERLLVEKIRPLIEELISNGTVIKWFFIRYNDPDHHLRIRINGNGNYYENVISLVAEAMRPYIDSNLVYRIQLDTYCRETERYGAGTIELSEIIFYYNSKMVIDFLALFRESDEMRRWLFSIRVIDAILEMFEIFGTQKVEFAQSLRDAFLKEFNGTKEMVVKLDLKYRKLKNMIWSHLDSSNDKKNSFDEAVDLMMAYIHNTSSTVSLINQALSNGSRNERQQLVASFIHMFINRLLVSNHRKQELVIYHFLLKYYRSFFARKITHTSTGRTGEAKLVS